MTEALAIVREYGDLIAAVRARMAELEMTFDILDHRSGVQAGYSSKILGPTPTKRFGPVSFGCILGALQMKIILVDDADAMRRWREGEKRRMQRPMLAMPSIPWLWTRRTAEHARMAQWQKQSPTKRREIARNAARARWRRAVR